MKGRRKYVQIAAVALMLAFTLSLVLVANLIVWPPTPSPTPCPSFRIDCKAMVTHVIDGDTVWVRSQVGFKRGDAFKVRLADIDAPEIRHPGGREAKRALESLILGKEVFLNVDDLRVYDDYGRVIAVIYLRIAEDIIMNVNAWMVDSGHATIEDHLNEFEPRKWVLYFKPPADGCIYLEVHNNDDYHTVAIDSSYSGGGLKLSASLRRLEENVRPKGGVKEPEKKIERLLRVIAIGGLAFAAGFIAGRLSLVLKLEALLKALLKKIRKS